VPSCMPNMDDHHLSIASKVSSPCTSSNFSLLSMCARTNTYTSACANTRVYLPTHRYIHACTTNLALSETNPKHPTILAAGDTGAAAVAESTITSTSLVTLALGGNRISDAGISAIANGMPSSMSTLNCNFNCVGDEGATALSRSIATGKTGGI
jgi:hypothetical protein